MGVAAVHDVAFQLRRRRMLALASLWVTPGAVPLAMAGEAPTGWVQPRLPAPPLRITTVDGRHVPFAGVLVGKVTAVQLMFTGCSSTCPPQGALFAALAKRLRSTDTQLLSISIDALGDTPATMSAWQARFGTFPSWHTAVADATGADLLCNFMQGAVGRSGTHTAQAFVFDRRGQLCYRTGDSPGLGELEALIAGVAHLG